VSESGEAIQAFVQRSIDDPGHRLAWASAARARFAQISDREAMLRTIIDGTMARSELRIL